MRLSNRPFLRHAARRCAAWLAAATLSGGAAIAQAGGANGLIVQLRDAPSHEALARERALGAAGQALARHEDERWQRVLGAAGVAARGQRASGRAARLLAFESRLSDAQAEALAARLQSQPEVAWAVPNSRERRLEVVSQVVPNDPQFGQQWWLHPVSGSNDNAIAQRLRGVPGFQRGWLQTTGSPQARVAVLDTGIVAHAELAGRTVGGYDFVADVDVANDGNGRDADPSDPGDWVSSADAARPAFDGCVVEHSSWHGTLIAGLIAASTHNGTGVAAASWDARVVPVRVAGKCGADLADIVDAVRWAAGLAVTGVPPNPFPARIINISFGGSAPCNAAYQGAIDDARRAGAVVVAAAGNESTTPTRPASCQHVIGVAAVNRDGFKTYYSNFGPTLAIATVGGDDSDGVWGQLLQDGGLLTIGNTGFTTPGADNYARLFGTSFSAPITAGALSLMLSLNPNLSADQLAAGLALSARAHVTSPSLAACSATAFGRCQCSTATCGAGLLDVEQALLYARDPAAYVAPAAGAVLVDTTELRAAAALGADTGGGAPPPSSSSGGGGGGAGAMDVRWLLALLLASATLLARRD